MLTTRTSAAARCSLLLSGLLVALGCGTPPPQENDPQDAPLLQQSQDFLQAAQKSAGLDASHSFAARTALQDELQLNVRYDHLYRGVKVWGGDVVVHTAARGSSITGALGGPVDLNVQPNLTAREVRALVDRDLDPRGAYVQTPAVELVIYPRTVEQVRPVTMRGPGAELNAEDIQRVVVGHTLAYHVHAELENGAGETSHTDYLFDARTGETIQKWDSLETAAATGTGNSQYSSTVSLGTNSITGGWELRDVGRAMNFATYNLNHGTTGTGSIFTDTDNTWGDGANYIAGGSTTSANGQTAGVDAHFGIAKTYDYYKNVHGRNGIDNANTATYNRVHYSSNYDNAFWSDTCFCMTYGDGSSFKVLTAIDVAGHEMTHGVTARTANLTYSGESGGLNEATSDIHGTMVEFYSRGGSGSTIGNTGGTWTIGEQLSATPLRYMYKPSKDGSSADAWYSGVGNLDVHYSSGPLNRAFYFLSQGSSSTAGSDFYSSYLPAGMTGVGNDHAARIAYRALTVYMTSSTNYAAARTAFLNSASDLYGGTASADYAAVENAFAAINVGAPHGGGGGGGGGGTNLLLNPGFESGAVNWTQTAGVISSSTNAHAGTMVAWLDGYGTTHTDSIYQTVAIPSTATSATLSFWLKITTAEAPGTAYDTLKVQLRNTAGTVLTTLATYSNLNSGAYSQKSFDVTAYKGQTVQVYFLGVEDSSLATSFFVDDTSLATQ